VTDVFVSDRSTAVQDEIERRLASLRRAGEQVVQAVPRLVEVDEPRLRLVVSAVNHGEDGRRLGEQGLYARVGEQVDVT
jgi:tRNA uridine 5-carbamoylmethylation protein Kti12